MSADTVKADIRVQKTEKAINLAMLKLLEHQKFAKITVNELCDEALISRATFYSYFHDKYKLLEYWLINFAPHFVGRNDTYVQIGEVVNQFVCMNEKIIKNLIEDADNETLEILCKHIFSISDIDIKENGNWGERLKYVVLSNFYSGGIIYYLTWQIKNKFPADVPAMNMYLYKIIEKLREFEAV